MEEEKPSAAPQHIALKSGQKPSDGDTHVTWDEETIALHDMDRGTRMKIDEPDTPYHYYAEGDDVGGASPARSFSGKPPIQWDELQSKLQDVKDRKKSEWNCSDDEGLASASGGVNFAAQDSEEKQIMKDSKFAEKRKSHYNEFEQVRAWKMKHAAEDDEDEDEESEEKQAAQP